MSRSSPPSASRCTHTRPPIRSRASSTRDLAAARLELAGGDEAAEARADHDDASGHAAEGAGSLGLLDAPGLVLQTALLARLARGAPRRRRLADEELEHLAVAGEAERRDDAIAAPSSSSPTTACIDVGEPVRAAALEARLEHVGPREHGDQRPVVLAVEVALAHHGQQPLEAARNAGCG